MRELRLLGGMLLFALLAGCGNNDTDPVAPPPAPPALSVADAQVAEGNSGSASLVFTLSLSRASAQAVSVSYATSDLSASAGVDYVAASGTLTIPAGQTAATLTVSVNGDTVPEPSEMLRLTLSAPQNAALADAEATGTILDDDGARSISSAPAAIDEPDSGEAPMSFTLTLDSASADTISVDVATADGTALAGSDYTALPTTTVVFTPGQTQRSVSVQVRGDFEVEDNESFALNLSNAVNGTIATPTVSGTIRNDDVVHNLGIDGASLAENGGMMNFVVQLQPPSTRTVTVDFASSNGTATAGADYTATNGTLTFAAGETSKLIPVAILNDTVAEGTETFTVTLTNASNATIADASGEGTITDDDAPPPPASLDSAVLPDMATADRCDFLDNHYCLFPYPNDYFTVAQAPATNAYGESSGRRLNFNILSMPRNSEGKPIDPAEWNRNDGFSPGQAILVRVPGFDLVRTGAAPITNIRDSLRADQPIVVIDAETLERHLAWVEVDADVTKFGPCDSVKPAEAIAGLVGQQAFEEGARELRAECAANPSAPDPTVNNGPALVVRPAVNFKEGHRYIVAMRNLKDAGGATIEAQPAFRIYRDNVPSQLPPVNARRAHMEDLLATLASAGIERPSLYLAWDFTVASQRNLSERVLAIRDDAFGKLGAASPAFTIRNVDVRCTVPGNPNCPQHQGVVNRSGDDRIAREVFGTITVPSYLTLPGGSAGSRLFYRPDAGGPNGDGLPDQNPSSPTQTFSFLCRIPRATFKGNAEPATATDTLPARPSLYGHGLLGSMYEGSGQVGAMTNEHNFIYCATDWIGMASHQLEPDQGGFADPIYRDPPAGDVPNVASILIDMSNFPTLADRVQQGVLNFHYLARVIKHPAGFCSSPAFQDADGDCLIDRSEVFYDGNSQGGIIGGVVLATSPDISAGVLGVPGMNYSTLLQRSVDFDAYAAFFYASYRSSLDQQFVLSFIQGLWDRAENNGYAHHINATSPYPGTSPKRALLHPAYGDHQVSMWTAEVMSRTIGASVHCPAVVAGASAQTGPAVQPGPHPRVAAEAALFDTTDNPFGFTHPQRRHPDDEPYFGLPCLTGAYAHPGNALVVWDSGPLSSGDCNDPQAGVTSPPTNNTPPRPSLCYGDDPHEDPRSDVNGRRQKSEFLKTGGAVVNVCGAQPCATREFDPAP